MDAGRAIRAGAFAGLAGAGIAAAGAGAAWHRLARRPLPKTEGSIEVEGVGGRVRVRRDRWAVPHIEAGSQDDVFFAQGFCHGQDRLWQMDFYRRVVRGRVSEMAGAEGLAIDRLMLTLGIRRAAEREVAALDPEVRRQLEVFCAGVNAAAAAAPAPPFEMQLLRLEFSPWQPADILSLGKLLAFGLSTNWEKELLRSDMTRALGPELAARLDPGYPADNPVASQEPWSGEGLAVAEQIDTIKRSIGMATEASGSNNWAISGGLSKTGSPLIAGDPHLPPSMPGIWYQVGLELGERFVRGASLPGMPGVNMGQNNDVCWTFTNTMADIEDLFVERIEGETYLFEDEWRPLEIVVEEIPVKGREPERLEVRATHHGPIVNEALGADEAEPLALRWLALDASAYYPGMYDLHSVESGPEMVRRLSLHTAPASNLIWADRHGSIGYKLIGDIPIRRGNCPDLPKPGWTGEFEWEGTVPYEELPETVDPPSGFVVTANNRVVGDEYPHHITSDWLDGYRARRIEELLRAGAGEHDLDGFAAMQTDVHSIPGVEAVARLSRLEPAGQRERNAIERLRSWDGSLDLDSTAATIYQAFLLRLAREVARAAIGDRDLAERWLDRADNGFTPHVTSPWRWHAHLMALWAEGDDELIGRPWDELVLESLAGGLDDLSDRFGPDPDAWRWGKVHEMEFPHPLGDANPLLRRILNRRLEVGGAQETVCQIAFDPNDPYRAIWAPSWRMVADPTDPDRSRWQMFTGQSGHPGSPHYDDLQAGWQAGRTQPMAGEGPWQELELKPG